VAEAPRNDTRVTEAAQRPPILRVPQWGSIAHLVHGFCGRRGGGSQRAFADFNLSFRVGDAAGEVRENWERLTACVGGSLRFATMQQVHGGDVAVLRDGAADAPAADALITDQVGAALCVLTADCVPILLVAPARRVIAAVHAGWRGTVAGVATRAVLELERRFGVRPVEILVALGPAIGPCCYEVDRDIVDQLEVCWGEMPGAVRRDGRRPGGRSKGRLDLRRANFIALARAGIPDDAIAQVGPCTRCASAEYFSYRAACAATGSGVTGRQVSFIGWQA
jgi:YfiH family protein